MLGGLRSTNCTALVMCNAPVPGYVRLMSAILWHSLQPANTEDEPPPWITADWRTSCGQPAIWFGVSQEFDEGPPAVWDCRCQDHEEAEEPVHGGLHWGSQGGGGEQLSEGQADQPET